LRNFFHPQGHKVVPVPCIAVAAYIRNGISAIVPHSNPAKSIRRFRAAPGMYPIII
jgi:hypothetical protein